MKQLALAIAITSQKFVNVIDKGGVPYILHCLHVMNNVKGNEDVKCAAVMHDLLEDTHTNAEELLNLGFSLRTIQLLQLLTRDIKESYHEYIQRIATDSDAILIKLEDLRHNSDITRIKGLRKKDIDRMYKYHQAFIYLSNV